MSPKTPHAFYHSTPLRFACTGCGKCCTGGPDEQVFLFAGEAERIRAHLSLSKAWFRRRYLTRFDTDQVLRLNQDGSCVFLKQGQCRIYPVRPLQCRTYPFWPEVLRNRGNWLAERRHCEGIGQGEPVPVKRIESMLRQLAVATAVWDADQGGPGQ